MRTNLSYVFWVSVLATNIVGCADWHGRNNDEPEDAAPDASAARDGSIIADASIDAVVAVDAGIDATPDAMLDAALDAALDARPDMPPATIMPVAEFCAAYAALNKDLMVACCTNDLPSPVTPDEYATRAESKCLELHSGAAFDDGLVYIDETRATAALNEMRAHMSDCSVTRVGWQRELRKRARVGTIGRNGLCEWPEDGPRDLSISLACAPGTECMFDDGTYECVEYSRSGGNCDTSGVGTGICDWTVQYCIDLAEDSGECATRKSNSAECIDDSECQSDYCFWEDVPEGAPWPSSGHCMAPTAAQAYCPSSDV